MTPILAYDKCTKCSIFRHELKTFTKPLIAMKDNEQPRPIDYSRYTTPGKPTKTAWQAPFNENLLSHQSAKLPASTRVYPEYLGALYAYFEQVYNTEVTSLSELIAMSVMELVKLRSDVIESLPPPEVALDLLISLGFITGDNKRAFAPMREIRMRANESETKAYESSDLKHQYDYWKDRDPEKAEAILRELSEQMFAKLVQPPAEQKEPAWKQPRPEETIVTDHKQQATAEGGSDLTNESTPENKNLPVVKEDKLGLYGDNRLAGILPDDEEPGD